VRTNLSTHDLFFGYTHFRGPEGRQKPVQDLAQPPTIVWRDKQMNVEETPVPEAVCWANDVLADAGCNRPEATPGDTW
jgi:hypothetical protein